MINLLLSINYFKLEISNFQLIMRCFDFKVNSYSSKIGQESTIW
jgi:hypothetical protein